MFSWLVSLHLWSGSSGGSRLPVLPTLPILSWDPGRACSPSVAPVALEHGTEFIRTGQSTGCAFIGSQDATLGLCRAAGFKPWVGIRKVRAGVEKGLYLSEKIEDL